MLNRLNNLYIEKQYLSLSSNAKNIQPLMSSIHAQIYPGQGDELTKHSKIYIKTNKPLGSERDIDNIDYSVNDREYHRNELQRIKAVKKRPKSSTRAVLDYRNMILMTLILLYLKNMKILKRKKSRKKILII